MNKRNLIRKIVDIPKDSRAEFWKKEFKLLNDLLKIFPDENFWEKSRFDKVPSLAIYMKDEAKLMHKTYKNFYYVPPEITISEIKLGEKAGEDYNTVKKPNNIKGFLK